MKTILQSLMILLTALCAAQWAGATQGEISFTVGTVRLQKAATDKWLKARIAQTVQMKDVVKTEAKSSAEIKLDQGTVIRVAENTTLRVGVDGNNINVNLENGKAHFKVAKMKNGGKFNITSPTATIGVRGTEFVFESTASGGVLYVIDGNVGFGKDEGHQENVTKNFMATLDGGTISARPMTASDMKNMLSGMAIIIKIDKSKENREELRDVINKNKDEFLKHIDQGNEKRDGDFAFGRTVMDRDGNIIRVDQVLRKTAADTFQFVNVWKGKGLEGLNKWEFKFAQAIPDDLTDFARLLLATSGKKIQMTDIKMTDSTKNTTTLEANTRIGDIPYDANGAQQTETTTFIISKLNLGVMVTTNNSYTGGITTLVGPDGTTKLKMGDNGGAYDLTGFMKLIDGSGQHLIPIQLTVLDANGKTLTTANTHGLDLSGVAGQFTMKDGGGWTFAGGQMDIITIPDTIVLFLGKI